MKSWLTKIFWLLLSPPMKEKMLEFHLMINKFAVIFMYLFKLANGMGVFCKVPTSANMF